LGSNLSQFSKGIGFLSCVICALGWKMCSVLCALLFCRQGNRTRLPVGRQGHGLNEFVPEELKGQGG
jgi:hypothetical protein